LLSLPKASLFAQDSRPMATLGRPVAIPADPPEPVRQVTYQAPIPLPETPVVRAQAPDPLTGPTFPPPGGVPGAGSEPYNCGVANQPPGGTSTGHGFMEGCKSIWGKCTGIFEGDGSRHHFESDHAFDGMISPVTNPFFFEDPRALTEARPIFIFQQAPDHNYVFHGGDIEFFGVQGRLAITNWLSFDVTKLGGIWMQPDRNIDGFGDRGGFAELILGPKFTFYRCENTGTVAAAGLLFDIPAGSGSVYQDTGTLSLIPYISVAQSFGRTSYGTFNFMGELGYNASVNNERSSNIFSSLHLDFDVLGMKRFYPLIELNWFDYTTNGRSTPLTFEGRDLFNFGSTSVSGHSEVSLAFGFRYKFCEAIQTGFAVEFPVTGPRDLMSYRLTFDLIFRY
jgi:hypothetical protein